MKIISVIWNFSNKSHWGDATIWLGWTVVCGLLPLWALPLIMYIFGANATFEMLIDDGEFLLYSAAYLGGAFYIVIKDFRNVSFPSKSSIAILMVFLLLVSVFTYSLVTTVVLPEINQKYQIHELLNKDAIKTISFIVFPISLFLTYMVVVAENIRQGIDLKGIRQQDMEELASNFDQLGD